MYTLNKNGARADQYYSYDPHGNVRWLVDDIPGFGKNHVYYEYDLISNKVLKVKYNELRKDRYFHRYSYDEDNRITQVETSKDNILWEKDANYRYYAHGPLKRASIGEDKIQGIDYTYTLHGWLKGLNSPNLIATEDPGRDTTINNAGYAPDVFGMALGYYEGDFTRAGVFNSTGAGKYYLNNGGKNLYNGNISQWQSKNKTTLGGVPFGDQLTGELYTYDRLNRIKSSRLNAYNGSSFTASNDYATDYSYDANGNLTSLKRRANSNILMDDLAYHYNTTDNKLRYVSDNTGASQDGTMNDIKAGQSNNNYVYDATGRLIRDVQSKLSFEWTVSDKLSLVIPDKNVSNQMPSLKFIYDPMGNRIAKEVNAAPYYNGSVFKDTITDLTKITTTFYVRDASGNVLSIYERTNAYSRDTSFYPCANDPIDSAVYKGIQYCYTGGIPAYVPIEDPGFTIVDSTYNVIASDTLVYADTSSYAGAFTLSTGGLLIIKGNYVPGTYSYNGGRIIIAPGASLSLSTLYLNSSSRIDNYGTLSLDNVSGIAGTIYNYGALNVSGNFAGNTGGTLINYGTLSATGGMEGNASLFHNYGSVYITGNFSNNGGTFINEAPMEVSGKFANHTGSVTNKCTIEIGDDLEIDTGLTNFGMIRADSLTTVNGGGILYLQGESTLETRSLLVYNIIRNDSTNCSLLRVTGGDLTEGSGATYLGNVTMCGVVTTGGGVAAWNSGTVYTGGQQVSHEGFLYEARYWTQGNNPTTNSGDWGVWINKGPYVPPSETDPDLCDCVPGKVTCDLVTKSLYLATIKQIEVPLYGSERLGDYRPNLTLDTLWFFSDSLYVVHIENSTRSYLFNDTTSEQIVYRHAGGKHYELKDHLGNVRVLVSDVKSPLLASGEVTSGKADLLAYYNYYPFGMLHPERTMNTDESRYGFNGKEKDDEIKGAGNSYDYGFRIYDPRIAKFMSVDPLAIEYPWNSTYAFAENAPIENIDRDGLEKYHYTLQKDDQGNKYATKSGYETHSGTEKTLYLLHGEQRNFYTGELQPATWTFESEKALHNTVKSNTLGWSNENKNEVYTKSFLRGLENTATQRTPLATKTSKLSPKLNKGTIYRVPESDTKSGKPYIGRHNKPTPQTTRKANDGRDRSKAEIIDTYDANNTEEGRFKEQKAIDKEGGVENTDNKRREVNPQKQEELKNKYGKY